MSSEPSVEQEIGHLVLRLLEAARLPIVRALGELDLTLAEGMALHHLAEPMPMRGLADAMGYDASYITGIVDRLEARGMVERRPDERDRRVKLLIVTPEGWRIGREVERRAFTANPVFEALDPAQREQLRSLLRLVVGPEPAAVDPSRPG